MVVRAAAAAPNGGAIYVATGGTLTILDTPISGSTVTGGIGGTGGQGFGGTAPTHNGAASEDGSNGAGGATAGARIFLNGVNATIGVSTGTVTYADTIGGAGATNGGATTAITKTGAGTLVLSAPTHSPATSISPQVQCRLPLPPI